MNRAASDPQASDVELVRRARDGESAAYAELVTRYQDRVFNLVYRMCANQADAADLVQTTFLKALESLDRFQERSAFYTWIFRIAVNAVISQRRTRQRRPTVSMDDYRPDGRTPALVVADNTRSPAQNAEERELLERLGAALEKLDDEFRAAVLLRDIEGLDYSAIAEILDVPVGTVKSRIHRGREMLRSLLTDEREPLGRASVQTD